MNTFANTQIPQYINIQGNKLAVVPAEYFDELLQKIEFYEEKEDLELYLEGKKDEEPAEPAEIVFKRIEENRVKDGR